MIFIILLLALTINIFLIPSFKRIFGFDHGRLLIVRLILERSSFMRRLKHILTTIDIDIGWVLIDSTVIYELVAWWVLEGVGG